MGGITTPLSNEPSGGSGMNDTSVCRCRSPLVAVAGVLARPGGVDLEDLGVLGVERGEDRVGIGEAPPGSRPASDEAGSA